MVVPKFGSIVLPPRFDPSPHASGFLNFSRFTFALTDGLWRLTAIPGEGQRVSGARDLVAFARRSLTSLFGEIPEPRVNLSSASAIELEFPKAPLLSLWRAVDRVPMGLVLMWPEEVSPTVARGLARDVFASWRRA